MTRLGLLMPQLQEYFPPQIASYLPQRSAQRAALSVIQQIEMAMTETEVGQPSIQHVVSLDASKAFPSISRLQLTELMQAVGLGTQLATLLEDFYSGETTFRVAGKYCHDAPHALRRGVHQGCPLSVMMFNLVQVPVITAVVATFDKVDCTIFADDIALIGSCVSQLQECLDEIVEYMTQAAIVVNPDKSQYWCSLKGNGASISICGRAVRETDHLTLLGLTMDHPVQKKKDEKSQKIMDALNVLKRLPLVLASKQHSFAAISMPSVLYNPMDIAISPTAVKSMRSAIIATLRPAIHRTARAQGVICLLCLHGHRVDPLMATMWRLLMMVQDYSPMQWALELHSAYAPWGPLAKLCGLLRDMGATFVGDEVLVPHYGPLPRRRPAGRSSREWQHAWRVRMRDALLRVSVSRRSDFRPLAETAIDWTRTMALRHKLDHKPLMRTYLEIVLSGALLTGNKLMRSTRSAMKMRCPFGCRAADTPQHRYWKCCRWLPLRQRWGMCNIKLTPITMNVGMIPFDSELEDLQVCAVQTFMSLVCS